MTSIPLKIPEQEKELVLQKKSNHKQNGILSMDLLFQVQKKIIKKDISPLSCDLGLRVSKALHFLPRG